jgi:hypothetical protein
VARIDWVKLRLENWARWHARMHGGGLGYASSSALLADPADRQVHEARMPVDEIEGSVTHQAVEQLKLGHGHLHMTLQLFYLRGEGISGTAAAMQRAESTVKANLERADHLLSQWFLMRRERKAQEAQALRQQIEQARPAKLRQSLPPAPSSATGEASAKPKRAILKLRSFTP